MAIRLDASADYLSRTANLPASTAFTISGWFRRRGAGGAAVEVLSGISRADLSSYYLAYVAGGTLYVEVNGAYTAAGAFSSDVWHFVALSSNGSGAGAAKIRRADVGATSLATTTRAGASFVSQLMVLCGVGDPNYYGNFAVAGAKVWDRELSDSELLSEMRRLTPASWQGLNLWTPMFHNSVASAARDFSGNGRHWTANGSLTIEDGPPIGWGGSIIVPQYAAGGGASAALGGAAAAGATAAGALTTQIKLAGEPVVSATAAGQIASPADLAGAAAAAAQASGDLTAKIQLGGDAVAKAGAAASLTAGGLGAPTGLDDTSSTPFAVTLVWNTDAGDDSYDVRFRSKKTLPSLSTVDGMDWYLDRMSQRTRSVTGKYRYRYTGAGVRVYVLDSGIRATHNQFAGRVASGYNAVPGAPSYDEFGHGTEVASCAAGTVAGTAKGATIVPVKVYSEGDEYLAATSDDYAVWYVDGLDWIINNHPVHTRGVVVSSIPAPGKASASAVKAKWQALIDMGLPCFEALPNLNAEGLPEGIAYYPDQMVIVAGMREVDAWDSTSNYADYVDIIAPSYDLDGIAGYGSDSEGINGSGNSYATGFVAGIAALLLEENPHATVDRILETMLQQANIGALSSVPSGTPNVLAYSLATSTDWVTHTDVTEPYTIDGLEPKSEYEIQVRRTVGGQTSDWSSSLLTETPEVQLGGGAPASATASGALTTAIKVAGAAVVAATASGAISTSIRLAGAAASVTLAGGDLTIQIRLQGDALAAAVAAAGLTTAIQLAAAAQAGAQASGELTTGGGAAALAGDALAAAIASGALTVQIRLDGAAVAGAIAQGVLTTGISLDGAAAVAAAAQGALSTEIRLAGAAIGSALASGDISGAAQLAGAAIGAALASGDLTTAIRLAGAALAGVQATGDLTAPGSPASLAADAQAIAIAAGGLTTSIRLAGAAASVVQATGSLDVGVTMQASAFASAMASGLLLTQIQLDGAAVAGALAAATLSVGTAEHGARVVGWRGARRQVMRRPPARQIAARPRRYG